MRRCGTPGDIPAPHFSVLSADVTLGLCGYVLHLGKASTACGPSIGASRMLVGCAPAPTSSWPQCCGLGTLSHLATQLPWPPGGSGFRGGSRIWLPLEAGRDLDHCELPARCCPEVACCPQPPRLGSSQARTKGFSLLELKRQLSPKAAAVAWESCPGHVQAVQALWGWVLSPGGRRRRGLIHGYLMAAARSPF